MTSPASRPARLSGSDDCCGIVYERALGRDSVFGNIDAMATLISPRVIAASESLSRLEAVTNAISDLRLEGLSPSPGARALFEQFILGKLSEEELVAAVLT